MSYDSEAVQQGVKALDTESADALTDWVLHMNRKIQELQRRVRRLEAEADLDFEMPDIDE